ncbi:beta-ketoacyl-[acyl-carrier-protein] synthase family protein [Streptomyces sp. URMC 123]|uniref:beta-ketoacyl-[acyl-carrier-protein] synthase family protein n=1 Tax=Streptomyces sp. URMC 123 TaxID=3423403 RepID=UPI003F1DF1B8
MSVREVAVTGLGLVTPAGIGVARNWETVCAGRGTGAVDPALDGLPVRISCRVPGFDAEAGLGGRLAHRSDRATQFALVAAREAVADAGLDPDEWSGARVGVVLGTGHGGCGTFEQEHRAFLEAGADEVSPLFHPRQLPNMAAGLVALDRGALGPNLAVSTACASGATAVGTARDLLLLNRCDVVLAGACEAPVTPMTIAGFARLGSLSRRPCDPRHASSPFDADRDGFVAAEGAAILVLERMAHARARGARVRARLVGYGATADGHHVTAPEPHGRGLAAAVAAALRDADAAASDVTHVNAHGTATPVNDRLEASVVSRVYPAGPLVTSTKGVTGHLLGAAGAVEAAYTVLAVEHATVPPTANLRRLDPRVDVDVATRPTPANVALATTHSMGFGGQNAVLAFAAS